MQAALAVHHQHGVVMLSRVQLAYRLIEEVRRLDQDDVTWLDVKFDHLFLCKLDVLCRHLSMIASGHFHHALRQD